jgi:predicted nucleic acid-binding protein
VTLVDSNVFMYAAGREHPHRKPATAFLEKVAAGSVEAIIDVEVLQEILHRYRALGRWEEGRQVYDAARTVFPSAVAITDEIVDRARRLLDEFPGLAARDAVVLTHGLDSICSFDRDFDAVRGLRRIEPR